MTLKTFLLVAGLLIISLLIDGCAKHPTIRDYPKEPIYNPLLIFDQNGQVVQNYDSAGNPILDQNGKSTSSLCAEYELTDPQALTYRHVKDWPLGKCHNIFGFTPSSIQTVNNWVRDALEKLGKKIQELEDQLNLYRGSSSANL